MEKKTRDIKGHIEKVLEQVGGIAEKLHTSVNKIDFAEKLDDGSIENLRLHLGYTKNYSDLAKTRLSYTKVLEGMKDDETEE